MPEMPQTQATVPSAVLVASLPADDFDYALGCECADPSLQIERWGLDDSSEAGEAN